ncbi:hypothetical protein O181_091515 [Austropuccinia psidii MF-1]|uniref:Brix domain-containing protein n=1 Tax=Austropuccinia psidii MF-1 TaxID=1389203 RepID=A0A9Q3IXX5_9BASI|nr:hypothetical protein [Austropuccinia psidii MF-1]
MAVINSTSQIANKQTRSKVSKKLKRDKAQEKLNKRLKQKKSEKIDPSLKLERLKINIPRTIENTKNWLGNQIDDQRTLPVKVHYLSHHQGQDQSQNQSQSQDQNQDQNQTDFDQVKFDLGSLGDLFTPYDAQLSNPPQSPPHQNIENLQDPSQEIDQVNHFIDHKRTLITTSPRPSHFTLAFIHELASIFGGARQCDVIPRKTKRFELRRVCRWAIQRDYGSIIVLGEDHAGRNRSGPTHMTISRLPFGPTASFKLTSIVPGQSIPGHAKPTSHFPELVLSNFSTPLGLSIGTLLQSIFPPLPELEGRQVVSVQNQRDFIFFRRFRYAFAERDQVFLKPGDENLRTRLQEIGPRFTLKVRWLKRGTLIGGLNENVLPGAIGHERKLGELERQQEASRAGRRLKEKFKQTNCTTSKSGSIVNASNLSNSVDDISLSAAPTENPPPKKRKRKSRTSSGIQEKFLSGERSDSEDPETTDKPRKSGGLSEFMKNVKERASYGRNTSRELEWEWKPKMGVSRRTFCL